MSSSSSHTMNTCNNSYNNSYNILNTYEAENNNENDTNDTNKNNASEPTQAQQQAQQLPIPNNNYNNSTSYQSPYNRFNNKINQRYNDFLKTNRGKIMIFIDGSNLFYTAQMMGIEIDYIKLVDTLVGKDSLIRACFYAGIDGDRSQAANWHFFMKRSGFRMIMKQLQTFADGNRKANCDVEMAVDMINLSDSFDTAVVCTGDGDLTYAINALINRGKQVEVVGSKYNTNDSLINTCDRFIDLESLRSRIIKAVRTNNSAQSS